MLVFGLVALKSSISNHNHFSTVCYESPFWISSLRLDLGFNILPCWIAGWNLILNFIKALLFCSAKHPTQPLWNLLSALIKKRWTHSESLVKHAFHLLFVCALISALVLVVVISSHLSGHKWFQEHAFWIVSSYVDLQRERQWERLEIIL